MHDILFTEGVAAQQVRWGRDTSILTSRKVVYPMASWSFLTNHALVLIHIGRGPDSTGLEIAQAIGITERAVRKILADLQAGGYIETEKIGRRNRYRVDT